MSTDIKNHQDKTLPELIEDLKDDMSLQMGISRDILFPSSQNTEKTGK